MNVDDFPGKYSQEIGKVKIPDLIKMLFEQASFQFILNGGQLN